MNIVEQFKGIIAQEQDDQLIPFLKTLTPDQKKQLTPLIKTLSTDYWSYNILDNRRWEHQKGTDKQRELIMQSAFVCLSLADYENMNGHVWFLHQEKCKEVITWYVPDWFNDYVNSAINFDEVVHEYDWIMQMTGMGALHPTKELLTKSIPGIIFKYDTKNKLWLYQPENLFKYAITLQEHIWYLFEIESNLHFSDRYMQKRNEQAGWKNLFKELAATGKIDRQRLLKESLLASNKNFNKVLSGWFIQLFADLEPTNNELIILQKEILGILNAPHSKPVNTALDAIKKILREHAFASSGFLDAVPVLLAADTKSIVNTTLNILEKIVQQQPEQAMRITRLACHTFIHHDDSLQVKAAQLIIANHHNDHVALQEELQAYQATLMSSARKMLAGLMATVSIDKVTPVAGSASEQTKELIPIPAIETIDDLVFLASQAFDNNVPWHISIFPAALVQWQNKIQPQDIGKLTPALQRALKIIKTHINVKQGELDYLLAAFFIDVCMHWVSRYAGEIKPMKILFEKFQQETNSFLADSEGYFEATTYDPYWQLLIHTLQKIRNNDDFPLLSTPTHEPGWIDPVMLTERFIACEESNTPPHEMDVRIAISRCYMHNTSEAAALGEKKLTGEYRNLLLFLFDKHTEPQPLIRLKKQWGNGHNDVYRILLFTPNNPEPILADILAQNLQYANFYEETDRKMVTAALQGLHAIWDGFGYMAHVFIATCMLSADKTIANLAAEIWINGVICNNIRSAEIGEAIGTIESKGFAPLKRLTDLIMQQLIRISDNHNHELQVIIENILKQLPGEPVINLKKLLEVYGEVLALTNSSVTDQLVLNKLNTWKSNKTIQKMAGMLLGK